MLVLLPTKEEVHVFANVCLSVCLSVSKITQKHVWILMKCCVSTDVGTWTNWLTFEPDPDHSLDTGFGLLSPVSYMRCYVEFYVGKIPASRGFKMVLFTSSSSHMGMTSMWWISTSDCMMWRFAADNPSTLSCMMRRDLRLESPDRRYRRGSSWLCDRDP